MQFEEYEIVTITPEVPDVFLIRLKPKRKSHIAFSPGQFYHIRNPTYRKPKETRQFSVITTPKIQDYLEFCIKIYGQWTKAFFQKKPGESVWLFGPMGVFTFRHTSAHTVFFAGGVGITPILSIIQSLHEKTTSIPLTLIYANKSSRNILKKTQIEYLFQVHSAWKLISLVSQIHTHPWDGRHGHITNELLQQEIDLKNTRSFYVCGSKRFTDNITTLLQNQDIPDKYIKKELFLPSYPKRTE